LAKLDVIFDDVVYASIPVSRFYNEWERKVKSKANAVAKGIVLRDFSAAVLIFERLIDKSESNGIILKT
jgi:hypothetical protein